MHLPLDIDLIQAKWVHELTAVAAMAWMTWDTIINLADEVDYLWRGDVSWVKWIYTFIRYAPIFHAGIVINHYGTKGNSSSTCKAYIAYELAYLEALTMAVEVILMIRVFVLYKLNQILRVVILVAFLAEVVSMIVTISFVIIGQHYTDDCIGDASPEIFVGYWITVQVFETFLFALTFAKCFRRSFRSSEIGIPRKISVLHLLLRDGTWAFALILVSTLLNLLLYQLNNTPRADDGYFWELAVLSYSGSHVILNIRRLRAPGSSPHRTNVSYLWEDVDDDQAFALDNLARASRPAHGDARIAHIEFARQS